MFSSTELIIHVDSITAQLACLASVFSLFFTPDPLNRNGVENFTLFLLCSVILRAGSSIASRCHRPHLPHPASTPPPPSTLMYEQNINKSKIGSKGEGQVHVLNMMEKGKGAKSWLCTERAIYLSFFSFSNFLVIVSFL